MVVLSGKNLGERHRELNNKVAEVIANKTNFDEIKIQEEISDVDKLYKIDIACQYRDLAYIVEILKSGDSLYISRALKCLWLYNDCYSHIINTENLHLCIFPYMSIKMKKKMLSTISMHVRNNDRSANFFTYCNKNNMNTIALKFLNFTSEEFKINVINNDYFFKLPYLNTLNKLQNFIVNSFVLATEYIETMKRYNKIILDLKFLYAVNDDKYLDILEKYGTAYIDNLNGMERFGLRISKDIMLKHKKRILDNPILYINLINKNILAKYSSKCEAKKYITSLMPLSVKEFWQIDFCTAYSYILDLIPIDEKFKFLKELFTTKYTSEPFEMTLNFYNLKYYNMMTNGQKELWALRHIDSQSDLLGNGNNYIWYKFVNIDKALIEIKKYVFITPDNHKRGDIVNVLVDSAREQRDLIKVLNYYNDRHANENKETKENFIDKVLSVHNVFQFNTECWEALNKIFCSLEIYTAGRFVHCKVFVAVAVACHIIHNKPLPQALTDFIDLDVNYMYFSLILERFGKDKSEIVFQYLLQVFIQKLQPFEQDPNNKNERKNLKKYINNIYNLLNCFQKTDEQCPEIVRKFMDIHLPKPEQPRIVTDKDILRFIKTDVKLAVDLLAHFDLNINDWPKRLNSTFRKLKVYFQNDVAQEFIIFLDRWIPKFPNDYYGHKLIDAAIFGIFQLGDENYKVSLMEKYHPAESKIDHSIIDRNLLAIREAICKFVSYSRPAVPLEIVLKYIKGDYVQYCLPMFNMYLFNLPLPQAVKFSEAILNMPLSVQKHGLRLAFNCYSNEHLKTLLLSTWKMSKNISLRLIIYKSLFNKIICSDIDNEDLKELYQALRFFTSDLHQNDHEDIFDMLSSYRMPDKFKDDYLRTSWEMVIKLPTKAVNIKRQCEIIKAIKRNINLVQKDYVHKRIIEEHIHEILEQRRLSPGDLPELEELWCAKWQLTASYIIQFSGSADMVQCITLINVIFKKCVEMWNEQHKEIRIFRKFNLDFIDRLKSESFMLLFSNPKKVNDVYIYKSILDLLQETLPLKETYLIVWNLQLTIFTRTTLCEIEKTLEDKVIKSNHLLPEESQIISEIFANQIGNFVKDLLDKNKFYTSFYPNITMLIKNELHSLDLILRERTDFVIFFCDSLANIGLKETHLLSLMVLQEYELSSDKINRILKKIQEFQNEEVQSYALKVCGNRLL